jgi:hypothetical protein
MHQAQHFMLMYLCLACICNTKPLLLQPSSTVVHSCRSKNLKTVFLAPHLQLASAAQKHAIHAFASRDLTNQLLSSNCMISKSQSQLNEV